MNNYERTENLIRKNPRRRRVDTSHLWLMWILGAVLVLLIAGVGYYVYTNYQNTQYEKQLNVGNKYLKKKDYKKAKIAYQKATKIRKRRPEAQERLAQCAQYTNDYPLARETWWYLYELTHSPFYRRNAQLVSYGNSNGNLSNGGNIAQYGCTTYISQMDDNSVNHFYRINDYSSYNSGNSEYTSVDKSQIYEDRSTTNNVNNTDNSDNSTNTVDNSDNSNNSAQITEVTSANPNQPVTNLNAYADKLYYINGGKVYCLDTTTGQTSVVLDNYQDVQQLMVHDGKAYVRENKDGKSEISRCDLDGQNKEDIHIGVDDKSGDFLLDDDKMLVVENGDNNAKVSAINLEDKKTEEIATEEGKTIDTIAYNEDENKMVYNCKDANGKYDDSVYALNPDDKSKETLTSPGNVSSVNQDGENLFYTSNDKVYKGDFDGGEGAAIGDAPKENAANSLSSIGTSSSNLFVTSSDPVNNPSSPNLGDNMKINAAPLDNIADYKPLDPNQLYIEDQIIEEPEEETEDENATQDDSSGTDTDIETDNNNTTVDENGVDVEDSSGDQNVVVEDDTSTDSLDDKPLRVIYD